MYDQQEAAVFLFTIAIVAIDAYCCLGWSHNETCSYCYKLFFLMLNLSLSTKLLLMQFHLH